MINKSNSGISRNVKELIGTLGTLVWIAVPAYMGYHIGHNVGEHQTKLEHERLNNQRTSLTSSGYTRLTDMDYDGKFDVMEELVSGPNGTYTIYFKKGYGPARSIDAKVVQVESEFFKSF